MKMKNSINKRRSGKLTLNLLEKGRKTSTVFLPKMLSICKLDLGILRCLKYDWCVAGMEEWEDSHRKDPMAYVWKSSCRDDKMPYHCQWSCHTLKPRPSQVSVCGTSKDFNSPQAHQVQLGLVDEKWRFRWFFPHTKNCILV